MSKDTAIKLVSNPIEKDYEDYLCAYFQGGGLYVEKNIIYREDEELLELDIIYTDFHERKVAKELVEIKSKDWGFSDIFKVKGWMSYLRISKSIFIVQRAGKSFDFFKRKAEELDIRLIDNSDLTKTGQALSDVLRQMPEKREIDALRFAYLLERKIFKWIKNLKKSDPTNAGFKNLDKYFHVVNSGSFFIDDPIERIGEIFDTFIKYKNITAKICHQLTTGDYDEEVEELSKNCFESLFYQASSSPLQIGLYVEHMARLTILKTCIEHLLTDGNKTKDVNMIKAKLRELSIPRTIRNGLEEIIKERYFHLYPVFWQFFTYVLGGFILLDKKDDEYKYLSTNTGIPVEEIDNAFNCFNKLFPKAEGWMFKIPKSNILWHRFFPIPFSGIGANHRRFLYLQNPSNDNPDFNEFEAILTGNMTVNDLIKWNNLAYEILK